MTENAKSLTYLEHVALNLLYQYRDRVSSPVRYVALPATIDALIRHQPPLAQWVGKRSDNQVHITPAGIAFCEAGYED